ncbi:Plasmodium exported protein, unknown function [Plasmodium ovale wallikeri]|uniref:Pv-fam-d protein n=2 Tax=Plasmodium ovale TaxID=36330 RepID=A0A1A8Z0F2_PLAOA|nr:Plasmodium exported protein, unknown function [Plasmodium ovale wallikeri]SBT37198.1 Plasmodium exported protein, unknown function [Plasmodium ovale wallikeri]SBT73530.1 Plasmodium exported protein, unknown function [Plasmodium ovale]
MTEKTNKILLCFNILFLLSAALWKFQYSNELITFDYPLDGRISRLLKGETDVHTLQRHPYLKEEKFQFTNQDYTKFANEFTSLTQDEDFQHVYGTLKNNDFMERYNTLKPHDSFEKGYNSLNQVDNDNYIDYIDDSYDYLNYDVYAGNNFHNDYYHYTQKLNSLEKATQYRNETDTFVNDDRYKNYHKMLKDPFQRRYKSKKEIVYLRLIKFLKKLDRKYEAKMVKLIERECKINFKDGNKLLKSNTIYSKVLFPALAPPLLIFMSIFVFIVLGLPLGVFSSLVIFELSATFTSYKLSKFFSVYKKYKRNLRKKINIYYFKDLYFWR